MTKDEELYEAVYSTVITQLWLNQVDEFKKTSLYRYQTKQAMKRMEEDLSKQTNYLLKEVFSADEDTMFRCMDAVDSIVKRLAKLSLEDVILIGEVLEGVEKGQVKIEAE